MSKYILPYILLFPFFVFCQNREMLQGRVVAGENPVSNIYVINATAGTETITRTGNFSIEAQPGDRLVFYHKNIITREFILKKESFSESPLVVSVNLKAYEMNEVVIDKFNNINEESLGLVPKGQKQYTPAERRLKTAGEFKPIMLFGILGGALPVDPIINAITGRTKMLKKELAVERKEQLLDMTGNLYETEAQIAREYNIPEAYTKGFMYYCIDDTGFANAVKAKDTNQAKFLMAALAEKYLQQIESEQ